MSKYSVILLAAWVFLITFSNGLGRLEGFFNPVVEGFTIQQVEDQTISGSFIKQRNCDFVDIKWFYMVDGKTSATAVEFLEPSKVREKGFHEYGPWKLSIPEENILKNSYAEVIHNCHGIWNTVTQVYP